MAHTHCIPYTKDYKHTLRICKAYSFSTATMVERTRLDVDVICALSGSVQEVTLQWHIHTYMCSHQMSESFTVLDVTAELKEL